MWNQQFDSSERTSQHTHVLAIKYHTGHSLKAAIAEGRYDCLKDHTDMVGRLWILSHRQYTQMVIMTKEGKPENQLLAYFFIRARPFDQLSWSSSGEWMIRQSQIRQSWKVNAVLWQTIHNICNKLTSNSFVTSAQLECNSELVWVTLTFIMYFEFM